jgi:CheY-like chemotaxis protein
MMERYSILFCDDNRAAIQWITRAAKSSRQFEFNEQHDWCSSVRQTLAFVKSHPSPYDVAVIDMNFEGENRRGGLVILKELKRVWPLTEVIVLTAHSIEVSIDEILKVEPAYRFDSSTWLRKDGSDLQIANKLAEALKYLIPILQKNRLQRYEQEKPYQIELDDQAGVMRIYVSSVHLQFDITGLQHRHLRLVRILAEAGTSLPEAELIARLHRPTELSQISQMYDRETLIKIGEAIGSPTQLCTEYLADDLNDCGHYEKCFPVLSKAQITGQIHSSSRSLNSEQCPLHLRYTDFIPKQEKKEPKRLGADINFLRKRIIEVADRQWEPLSRSGAKNDLLRRTASGYRLAAILRN